jgi:hypothetical protein
VGITPTQQIAQPQGRIPRGLDVLFVRAAHRRSEPGVIFGLLISLLIYRGIEISAAFVVWLTIVDVVIMIALAIAGLMHPGDGRVHLQDFVSVHAFGKKGFYLAIVFSIFTYTGFEAIAPLAEETRNPRRSLPRAVLLSITVMVFFFVFTTLAILTGWGTSQVDTFAVSVENFHLFRGQHRRVLSLPASTSLGVQPGAALSLPRAFDTVAALGCLPLGGTAAPSAPALRSHSGRRVDGRRSAVAVNGEADFQHAASAYGSDGGYREANVQ